MLLVHYGTDDSIPSSMLHVAPSIKLCFCRFKNQRSTEVYPLLECVNPHSPVHRRTFSIFERDFQPRSKDVYVLLQ